MSAAEVNVLYPAMHIPFLVQQGQHLLALQCLSVACSTHLLQLWQRTCRRAACQPERLLWRISSAISGV